MTVRPQTINLVQKVEVGVIQSASVVTLHATTANTPLMASDVHQKQGLVRLHRAS